MHKPIYQLDSYTKEFDSKVKEVIDGKFIVLEDTAFYPRGGGQPCDYGTLIAHAGVVYKVLSVTKKDGLIIHELESPGLIKGDKVHGTIDWERRYKLMRMHTAAHVLCGVFEQREETLITGNQLDLEQSRVDLSLEEFNREKMKQNVEVANGILNKELPIEVSFIKMEDAKKNTKLFKLAMEFPHDLEEIRLVDIVGHDLQADGGTHVKNTKEVGKIVLLKCENKGKNKRRVYFGLEP